MSRRLMGRWCRCGHRQISHGPEVPPFAYCTGYQREHDPFAGSVRLGSELDTATNARVPLVNCNCKGFVRRRTPVPLVTRIAPEVAR